MLTEVTESTEQFLSGGGEMGKLIRGMDWSKTALGKIEDWPQSLRTSVSLCLSSTFPILIAWGPETIQIYNDSYRPICGAKHPDSMGMNYRICWETALEVVRDTVAEEGREARFLETVFPELSNTRRRRSCILRGWLSHGESEEVNFLSKIRKDASSCELGGCGGVLFFSKLQLHRVL